jgi:ATP-dependent DNA helicase RecG
MTATPIPRTLALTIFGSLDLTLLDEMPAGRKPIITKVVTPKDRNATYEAIRKELQAGRQAYIICPRINEPDPDKEMAVIAKSVKAEAERLQKSVFAEYQIDILHSKMTPAQKEKTMQAFEKHETDILVATSVVEVGVNVPNATVILIEGAERFGLAQLHQLRGRVIRSNNQAYCYVFAESAGEKTVERLKALVTAKNGFELAEFDLQQRGTGDLMGRKQWGISDLAMEAMKNLKLVEAARIEAQHLVASDQTLTKHQSLLNALAFRETVHFE